MQRPFFGDKNNNEQLTQPIIINSRPIDNRLRTMDIYYLFQIVGLHFFVVRCEISKNIVFIAYSFS